MTKFLSLIHISRQWREANPQYEDKNINIRDVASINELVVLSHMASFNAELIKHKAVSYTHLGLGHSILKCRLK